MFNRSASSVHTWTRPYYDPIYAFNEVKTLRWSLLVGHYEAAAVEIMGRQGPNARGYGVDKAEPAFPLFAKVFVFCVHQVIKQAL